MHPSTKRVAAWVASLAVLVLAVVGYVQVAKQLDDMALKIARYADKNPQAFAGWSDVARIAPVTSESTIRVSAPHYRQWMHAYPPEAAYDSLVEITNGTKTKRYTLMMFVYLTPQGARPGACLITLQEIPSGGRGDLSECCRRIAGWFLSR